MSELTSILSSLANNGKSYVVKYRDRGAWYFFTGEIVACDGKFLQVRNDREERILSLDTIDGVRRED